MTARRWHFIGIGGAGMSAVAWLAHRRGDVVTGSDAADGPYLRALRDAGVDVAIGHDASAVEGVDAVVVSTAIRDTNPELAAAREAALPVLHRSAALAEVLEGRRVVAVAGAHGKTTTSAMVAHILRACGFDPTFAIGAPVLGVEGAVGGAFAGGGDVAVIEADESDGSFLAYRPAVAIVTNVEADHLDHFGTPEAVEDAFVEFVGRADRVITCGDDAGAARVAVRAAASGVAVETYGWGLGSARDIVVDSVSVARGTESAPLAVPQPGRHNRLNAAAAWAAALAVGADPLSAARSLATFPGTGRRYELRGVDDGVRVVDDYAHHPTEIAAMIGAARERETGRLLVLFQPHLYSRTRLLAEGFAESLARADAVVVAGVYGAREDPEPGIGPRTITDLMTTDAEPIDDLREAAHRITALSAPGDTIFTVGAGSVTDAADWILEDLAERAAARD